jgi:hypothetical protein
VRNKHYVAGFNIPVDSVFVGISQRIKQLPNYMKNFIKSKLLSGGPTLLYDVPKLKLALNQLHAYKNKLAEVIRIDSLLHTVGSYDIAVRQASCYHRSLLEAVNRTSVCPMAGPYRLDCNFFISEMVIGFINHRLPALADFFYYLIMVVPYFM